MVDHADVSDTGRRQGDDVEVERVYHRVVLRVSYCWGRFCFDVLDMLLVCCVAYEGGRFKFHSFKIGLIEFSNGSFFFSFVSSKMIIRKQKQSDYASDIPYCTCEEWYSSLKCRCIKL